MKKFLHSSFVSVAQTSAIASSRASLGPHAEPSQDALQLGEELGDAARFVQNCTLSRFT
jgi:hypothetical protein